MNTPKPDLETAVWTMNHDHATRNLLRELREVAARAARLVAAVENGHPVGHTDARSLTADVFEACRYATEVNTLNDNRPSALRNDEE